MKTLALLSLILITGCTGLKASITPPTLNAGGDITNVTEMAAEAKAQAQIAAVGDNTNLEEGATHIEVTPSTLPWLCGTFIFCLLVFCCRNISFSWQIDIEADKKKSIQRIPNQHVQDKKD